MQRQSLKAVEHLLEYFFVRIAGGHSNPNAPDRYLNLGADLQQLQANRGALRPLQVRTF